MNRRSKPSGSASWGTGSSSPVTAARAVRIPLDPHRPGPAADLAILHQHVFARLEIRRLDFDAARLAAERTFDLEDHRLSLTDPTASGQEPGGSAFSV